MWILAKMQKSKVALAKDPCIKFMNKCASSIHRIASKEINMQPICNRSWPETKSHFLFILWASNFGLLQWDIWKLGRCQNALSRLCHEALLGQTQSCGRQSRFHTVKSTDSGAWPYSNYSRVRNKHPPTFIYFWNFFQGLMVLLRT